jgi:hypothetical protein
MSSGLRHQLRQVSPEIWEAGRLRFVPEAWAARVRWKHADLGGSWSGDANGWLLDHTEAMAGIRVPVNLTDAEICDLANRCAREAMNLADGPAVIDLPALRARLAVYVGSYGITPPEPLRMATKGRNAGKMIGVADAGAVRRMTDAQWWRRALRRHQARAIEREAISLGYVHRRGEVYASDVSVERRAQQRKRNAATLEATQAINLDTGEVFTLAELAERANSNPAIRRGELMTRIAGFEAVAQGLGHVAEFGTITAPSKYHAKKMDAGKVIDNPKFSGATPRETQSYLTKTWAKCRAALARYGISIYGFRIAEPHHDATPHWHCLFFMPALYRAGARMVPRFRAIVRRYFLWGGKRKPGQQPEEGARRNRVKFIAIDPAKGTAAGYIAKYVAKNIDGFQVQGDFEGENLSAVTGSQRVETWATTWGIRQFQQIGGAPVGVWRELRRIREENAEHSSELDAARAAADAGNWRRYTEVMGGPTVARADLPVRVAYTRPGERFNFAAGDIQPGPHQDGVWRNRYGEPASPQVCGVRDVFNGRRGFFQSSRYSWEIRRAGDVRTTRGGTGGGTGGGNGERVSDAEGGKCADRLSVSAHRENRDGAGKAGSAQAQESKAVGGSWFHPPVKSALDRELAEGVEQWRCMVLFWPGYAAGWLEEAKRGLGFGFPRRPARLLSVEPVFVGNQEGGRW